LRQAYDYWQDQPGSYHDLLKTPHSFEGTGLPLPLLPLRREKATAGTSF
jgi:hypothetical protein